MGSYLFCPERGKMEEFPSNAKRPVESEKTERPKVEKVVTGKVVQAKKPLGRRFAEVFVGGDARSAWASVLMDVLVPALKDMASDAVTQGFERMIYGDSSPASRRRPTSRFGTGTYTSYNRYSRPSMSQGPTPRPDEPRTLSRRSRSMHDFDEIVLETRAEAEEVLDRLFDIIDNYKVATVSDLYDLVGITGAFTDEKYGWDDLRGTKVVRSRNGYLVDLPRPVAID